MLGLKLMWSIIIIIITIITTTTTTTGSSSSSSSSSSGSRDGLQPRHVGLCPSYLLRRLCE
jgi:hypothetical protein